MTHEPRFSGEISGRAPDGLARPEPFVVIMPQCSISCRLPLAPHVGIRHLNCLFYGQRRLSRARRKSEKARLDRSAKARPNRIFRAAPRHKPWRTHDKAGLAMIGVVLVTHGALADEFRRALEHIVGPQEAFSTISIGPEDDMEMRRTEILDAAHAVDQGAGVVILTDMFGGTPSNLAISAMTETSIEVIAGVNLPLRVKLAKIRADKPMAEAIALASDAGRKYIRIASQILSGQ